MSGFLILCNANELVRIPAESLVYIASEGNYSDIRTCDGGSRTVTLQLGVIEERIDGQLSSPEHKFARIGKSLLVNLNFLHYINPARGQLVLSDCKSFKFTLKASREALRKLKDHIEKHRNDESF
ncbi:MAG: LytTR family transcriptional regulator DNA-binding domain-containing protein [Bacteroidales bacterium]|nr:LytTR family transcriptional regulator DNA-binding domain-containing protein [Bacteroidales bacterium]MCR4857733.1 LytTR family transcriptional regulator DNA-binding domain-containing protein [Bacteroidales bacterium]